MGTEKAEINEKENLPATDATARAPWIPPQLTRRYLNDAEFCGNHGMDCCFGFHS